MPTFTSKDIMALYNDLKPAEGTDYDRLGPKDFRRDYSDKQRATLSGALLNNLGRAYVFLAAEQLATARSLLNDAMGCFDDAINAKAEKWHPRLARDNKAKVTAFLDERTQKNELQPTITPPPPNLPVRPLPSPIPRVSPFGPSARNEDNS